MYRFVKKTIDCRNEFSKNSKRLKKFRTDNLSLNYESDKTHRRFINKLVTKGLELAGMVNKGAANNSNFERSMHRIQQNSIAGLMAEVSWKQFLNINYGKKIISFTEFEIASKQIDLINLESRKKIEVRSSFPRNGIDFAICSPNHEFDILGPYSNTIKPGEIEKEFYVRTLFHVPRGKTFTDLLKRDGFKVHLTGGATWEMMMDPLKSENKNLLPEDSILVEEERSDYRVVPFSEALDNNKIIEIIRS